jgi:hypothetical protein
MRPVAALPIVVTNHEGVYRRFSSGYLFRYAFLRIAICPAW